MRALVMLSMVVMVGCGSRPAPKPPAATAPLWEQVPRPPVMPTPTSTGVVEHDGAGIYYATYGSGPPVLLLHGGLGHGDVWGFQMPALAGRRVITIDSRGQGRSTSNGKPLTYADMASDVIAVMDHLSIDAAPIVGWSDGAILGIHLAMTQPARVTRVFAFGANVTQAGVKLDEPHETVGKYIEIVAADYPKIGAKRTFEQTATDIGDLYKREPAYTPEQLATIHVPVTVVDGDHEELILPDHPRQIAQWIPGARLVILENVSHLAPWQDPPQFNAAVAKFLQP